MVYAATISLEPLAVLEIEFEAWGAYLVICILGAREFGLMLLVAAVSSTATAGSITRLEDSANIVKAEQDDLAWLTEMSKRLVDRIPDKEARFILLRGVRSESRRAGLDPQLVLSVIDVASGFKKYAVASGGARGYMLVNPSWTKMTGAPEPNLFHVLVNLRYGCTLLRDFLGQENGDVLKALGRYGKQMGEHFEDKNHPAVSWADFPDTVIRLYKDRWRNDGGAAIHN